MSLRTWHSSLAALVLVVTVAACGGGTPAKDAGSGGGGQGGGGGAAGGGSGGGGGGSACTGQLVDCGGSCVDIAVDQQHCGNCTTACTAEQYCVLGGCVFRCGDNVLASTEQCDDGNRVNGDSCSSICERETGWTCSGAFCQPTCGDGLLIGSETCDDTNTLAGDGCGATCRVEDGSACSGQPSVCARRCGGDAGVPDDLLDCTIDSCAADGGVDHTPSDALCTEPYERCFPPTGCVVPDLAAAVITEFTVFGEQYIEIYNPTPDAGTIHGFKMGNSLSVSAEIRNTSDTMVNASLPVVILPGEYLVGAANPPTGQAFPTEADFLIGGPGTAFSILDGGDVLKISNRANVALDTVDFKTQLGSLPAFVTGNSAITSGQFPGMGGTSTQLAASRTTAALNDDGSNWCTTFRAPHTLGAANLSCDPVVINEVLYDFQNLAGTNDEGNTFIELAGAGGANLAGLRLRGMNNASTVTLAPDVTFAAGTRVPPNGFFVVADRIATGTISNVPNADLVLANGDPANGDAGNTIVLSGATGVVDKLGYGTTATAEGANPLEDINPASISFSLARDLASTDTNVNKTDFHFDPTPTPGQANAPVVPTIVSITPMETGSAVSKSVTVVARDFANLSSINIGTPTSREVSASFAGAQTATCSFTSLGNAGRGNVTLACTAPTNLDTSITPAREVGIRGSFNLTNPVFLAGTDSVPEGWTYVAAVNEYDIPQEIDRCFIQSPTTTITSTQGTQTVFIVGRAFHLGVTEVFGADPDIRAEVGYGLAGSDPRIYGGGWTWVDAPYNNQVGDYDEYRVRLTAPTVGAPTDYRFAVRVTPDDGVNWTYCDINGAGAGGGAHPNDTFELSSLGVWMVNP